MVKETVDQWESIDVRHLLLKPQSDSFEQIHLIWTPCNYGGYRPWFLCPVCGSRVLIVYRKDGSPYSCRTCKNLTFQSSQVGKRGRLLLKRKKLAERLGLHDGAYPWSDLKPKRMRWITFERLKEKYLEVQDQLASLTDKRRRPKKIHPPKRLGPGAPYGNQNALKHGRYTKIAKKEKRLKKEFIRLLRGY